MSSISSLLLGVYFMISLFSEIPTQLWSSSNYFPAVLSPLIALNLVKISSPTSLKPPFRHLQWPLIFYWIADRQKFLCSTTGSLWEGWEMAGAVLLWLQGVYHLFWLVGPCHSLLSISRSHSPKCSLSTVVSSLSWKLLAQRRGGGSNVT